MQLGPDHFNALYPVGTRVTFYPDAAVSGHTGAFMGGKISGPAYLDCGQIRVPVFLDTGKSCNPRLGSLQIPLLRWFIRHAPSAEVVQEQDRRSSREAFDELARIRDTYGPLASAHEALGVLEEEVHEFRLEVYKHRSKRDPARMRAELRQIAAVALRAMTDLAPS